jgi:hypothetical protein
MATRKVRATGHAVTVGLSMTPAGGAANLRTYRHQYGRLRAILMARFPR